MSSRERVCKDCPLSHLKGYVIDTSKYCQGPEIRKCKETYARRALSSLGSKSHGTARTMGGDTLDYQYKKKDE